MPQNTLHDEILDEFNREIVVKENGRPLRLTRRQAVAKALIAKAIGGDLRAMQYVLDLHMRLSPSQVEEEGDADTPPEDAAILANYVARIRGGGDV